MAKWNMVNGKWVYAPEVKPQAKPQPVPQQTVAPQQGALRERPGLNMVDRAEWETKFGQPPPTSKPQSVFRDKWEGPPRLRPEEPMAEEYKMAIRERKDEAIAPKKSIVTKEQVGKRQRASRADIDVLIDKYSKLNSLPSNLVKAVIHQESRFNSNAVSPKKAAGLMQLMPKTASWLGVEDSFDPDQNVKGGTKYLGQMMKKYNNNVEYALAAYNGGPTYFDRHLKKYGGIRMDKLWPETREYIALIKTKLGEYDSTP